MNSTNYKKYKTLFILGIIMAIGSIVVTIKEPLGIIPLIISIHGASFCWARMFFDVYFRVIEKLREEKSAELKNAWGK